jgi:hypothetical protein
MYSYLCCRVFKPGPVSKSRYIQIQNSGCLDFLSYDTPYRIRSFFVYHNALTVDVNAKFDQNNFLKPKLKHVLIENYFQFLVRCKTTQMSV